MGNVTCYNGHYKELIMPIVIASIDSIGGDSAS